MARPSQEDIDWFRSTFHPIPKPRIPEDCVEYSLYWIAPDSSVDASQEQLDGVRSALNEVQKTASGLVKDLLKGYIWQRDNFRLELTKEDGFNLLRGRTEYGDSIEDEWVIVYILHELTKKYDELWVKVTDSDGEFLLVEAAAKLPEWLEPNIANHRVWIHKGQLVIIQPKNLGDQKKKISEKLTYRDARKIILIEPGRLMRSQSIEDDAFYRLRKYPQQISENLHSSLATIPRKIAYLLHLKPSYVTSAVESFYLRDPISLRPLQSKSSSKLTFPLDDLVTVSVKFTKVSYAQLKSQDFDPPTIWQDHFPADKASKEYGHADTGMKLTCGFEMLLSDNHNQDKPAVREIKLVLGDIDTGDESLPSNEEIEKSWSKQDDDESWMNISMDDLEGELKGKNRRDKDSKLGEFGDKSAQENLQRIVAKFEEFLDDEEAGFDGAELANEFASDESDLEDEDLSSEGEDPGVSFDDEELSKMMSKVMRMQSGSGEVSSSGPRPGRVEEIGSEEDDEEGNSDRIEEASRQMEAELKEAGVFDHRKQSYNGSRKRHTDAKGKERQSQEEEGSDGEEDIDINLARNLLESLKSQGGAAGPGSNLLGLMGMEQPKYDRG